MKALIYTLRILIVFTLFAWVTGCSATDHSNTNAENKSKGLALKPVSDTSLDGFRAQGKLIVKETFIALSSELKNAIQEGGVPHALSFCNAAALPVTDSLAKIYDVDIKRVSLKNRNPLNQADAFEASLIETFTKLSVADLSQVNMVVQDADGFPVYAQPIILGENCLQCHGSIEKDIRPENLKLIRKLYPDDKAVDYNVGDLRGIWRIRFNIKVTL
ncbi:MAG: DUF3365 domain-containing protein [Bacteroidales bacterium]|nr:DUF3365 domain-containing protein [Bacteroidales bacterium]HOI33096.1 DUF3365 domain-containing protein [Bacteroidales bacterium]